MIADSDMRVRPDYLAEVTKPLADPRVGLVTCLYTGRPIGGVWSMLGAMHVNYGFLPSALIGDRLRPGEGCFGATIALRRETLAEIGGFVALRDQLADDYALGSAVRALGLKVVISPHVVETNVAEPSLGALIRHELRWARTIRAMAPYGYAGSVITHAVALAILALVVSGGATLALWFLAFALGCRYTMVRLIDGALNPARAPLWLFPARDLLSFSIFLTSFLGRSIAWRDGRFRLTSDGRLVLDGEPPA